MADLLILPGAGEGARYAELDNAHDVWTFVEAPAGPPAEGAVPYRRLGALGDVSRWSPFLYTVELEVAEADLPAVFAWYEEEHLGLLTACPGCLGGARYQRLDGGAPNLLAAYRFAVPDAHGTPEWEAARSTPWTIRMRPLFRSSRRYTRRLLG